MNNSSVDNSTRISGLSTQILSHESLFTRLRAGHTLITGNSRLSRVLTGQYTQWRIGLGDSQWQSPVIISWSLWLDKLWEATSLQGITGTGRAVPGNRQLISLWESTLKNEPLTHKLIRPESLASQVRDTRRLIAEWQLDPKDPAWFGSENENHAAFYLWNKAFEKRCEKANWISPEDRTALLCDAINNGLLSLPANIDLLGFDEFIPTQADLLEALNENGHAVCHLLVTPRNDKSILWKSRDSKTELQHMARWVRYWFEKEPESTIAVVVPDLQARRQIIE